MSEESAAAANVVASEFPTFAYLFDNIFTDYSWEAVESTTDDGYILNSFHIWKEGAMNQDLPPFFFQHGAFMAADMWMGGQMTMEGAPNEDSFFLRLINKGHHVYLGNQRGTVYSQGHTTLDKVTQPDQYWSFGFEGYINDILPQGRAIKENANTSVKPIYVGYSMGTLQMLAGLTYLETEIEEVY